MVEAENKKNTVFRVLRSNKGFSLSELLVTLVLVGLISLAMAGGIGMIVRSYTKVVDRADAEQLLSTTVSRITDELSYARAYSIEPVTVSTDKKSVDFVSGLTGMRVRIMTDGETMHMYYYKSSSDDAPKEVPLIDDKLEARMTINFSSIDFNPEKGWFTIGGLGVTLKNGGAIVAVPSYTVARINHQSQS